MAVLTAHELAVQEGPGSHDDGPGEDRPGAPGKDPDHHGLILFRPDLQSDRVVLEQDHIVG